LIRGKIKMRKRLITLVSMGMAVSMLAAITAGCGRTSSTTNTSKGNSKEATKPESVKFMINVGYTEQQDTDNWAAEFQRITGMKIEMVTPPNNQYYEKVDLAFASGDAPDVVAIGDDKLTKYSSQGALYDMTKFAENSEVVKSLDQNVVNAAKINGKIYGIPYENGGGPVTYMRTDWLKQAGKNMPTTYAEFIDALKSFKMISSDVIPLTAPGLYSYNYLTEFYQDARPQYTQKNGKWVDGFLEPEMKAALERMRTAYVDGLIDKEIVTNKTTACRDKWIAGRVGAFCYWAGDWNMTLDNRMKEGPAGKSATMEPIPAIKETKYIMRVPAVISITKNAKNPEGLFKYFVEYMHDGKEGSMLFRHGVEGKNYTKESNGTIKQLPVASKPSEVYNKAYVSPSGVIEKMTIPYNFNIDSRVKNSLDILTKNSVSDVTVPISKTLNKVSADVQSLREQTLSKAVLGDMTVDEALANYKKEIDNLGGANIVSEMNSELGK
jgi:putative aldouronate transport system substrate-binding protein